MYKVFINVNSQNLNDPILKWAKDQNRTIFQRRHINGQQVYEKVLSVINDWRNANKNHNETVFHTVRMVSKKKKDEITNFDKVVKKKEIFALSAGM